MRDTESISTDTAVAAVETNPSPAAASPSLLQRKIQRRALQRQAQGSGHTDANVQETASRGVEGPGGSLPHGEAIQASFGRHDVSGIHAHTGSAATAASEAIGARAYATGDHVAFAGTADLHTAAHEAAHVVQQRAGVALAGGVGREGDAYERHADEVADTVVRGGNAEPVLDRMAGSGGGAGVQRQVVQRDGDGKTKGKPDIAVSSVSLNRAQLRQNAEDITFKATVENKGTATANTILRGRLSRTPSPAASDPADMFKWSLPEPPFDTSTKAVHLAPGESKPFTIGGKMLDATVTPWEGSEAVTVKGKWFPGVTSKLVDADPRNDTAYGPEVTIIDRLGNGNVDPRMGYTAEAKEAAGKIDSQPLPYHNGTSWNSKEILTKWTQVDGYQDAAKGDSPIDHTNTDEFRCGPAVAMATVILDGPQALYGFAWRLSNVGSKKMEEAAKAGNQERWRELNNATGMVVGTLSEIIDKERGTFGTLSRLVHGAKMIMTKGAAEDTKGQDMVDMMMGIPEGDPRGIAKQESLTGATVKQLPNEVIGKRADFQAKLDELQIGERYTVAVDTDVRTANMDPTQFAADAMNHWVMIAAVGSKARRVVLYDPYPRDGSQISFIEEEGFWKYFVNKEQKDQWRGCSISTKSGRSADVTGKKAK